MYSLGAYAILGCDEDAGTVNADLYLSSTCAAERFYVRDADLFDRGSCVDSEMIPVLPQVGFNINNFH